MIQLLKIIEKINWKITYVFLAIALILLKIKDLIGLKLLIFLIFLSIVIPILLIFFKEKYFKYKYYPYPLDYKFMYEFLKITGFLEKAIIQRSSDDSHRLRKLKEAFIIDGTDCYTEKIYEGTNIKKDLSDGIIIWIAGGSSISFDALGIETFDISNENNIIATQPKLFYESERTKSIFIPFNEPIKMNTPFKVRYVENHWFGAMRSDFDGIVFNEHILFKIGLNEYDVKILFKKGKLNYVTAYYYDLKTNKINVDENKVEKISDMEYKWTKENPETDKIYLLMYRYSEPIINPKH